jgi:hypothetical protein
VKITNRAQFFELWEAGVLGNRTRLWRDPEEALRWASNKDMLRGAPQDAIDIYRRKGFKFTEIGFREIRKPGTAGSGWWERVPWTSLLETAEKWKSAGKLFIMDDGCPDEYRVLQGEVCYTPNLGLAGYLDTVSKLPMRPAMAAGHMKHYSPLETRMLLRRHLDPSSLADLDALLELYPDAAVEFTTFTCTAGVFPGRNTIFWETRDY